MNTVLISRKRWHEEGHTQRPLLRLKPWIVTLLCLTATGCTSSSLSPSRTALIPVPKNSTTEADVLIAHNTIYQNNRSGIRTRGNIPIHVKESNIYENGQGGLNLNYSSNTTITDCIIAHNKNSGVSADNASQIKLRTNRIHQNENGGIRIRSDEQSPTGGCSAIVKNNTIFLNQNGGVHTISNTPTPTRLHLSENAIYRNNNAGVRIEDNVHMSAVGNEINRNSTAGIAAYVNNTIPPMLDAYENKIFFNGGAGIFIYSGISGQIGLSNNLIYNNYRGGITCGLWEKSGHEKVDVEILHNTIVGNGSREEGAGIRNDSHGSVRIKNNIIAYNFTTGIMTRACRGNTYNLLFANGETSTTKDESQESTAFLLDKTQYAGCPERQKGDVLAVPEFINPDLYNFSLHKNSPALNAADPIRSIYFQKIPSNDLGANLFLLPAELPAKRP